MKEGKNFYLFFWIIALLSINGCKKKQVFDNNYFSIKIQPNWVLIEGDSVKYIFRRDTAYFKINIQKETAFNDVLLRTPEEYIKTEDANLLTNFDFFDSNTIYTNKSNIDYFRKSVLQDSGNRHYKIKEYYSPIIERFLKVPISNKDFTGIDYLGEFKYGNKIEWLPIKLPEYYNNFEFTVDTSNKYYKKVYFPKLNRIGKCGFIYHSYQNNFTLIMQSSLIYGSPPLLTDIKRMINSVIILKE